MGKPCGWLEIVCNSRAVSRVHLTQISTYQNKPTHIKLPFRLTNPKCSSYSSPPQGKRFKEIYTTNGPFPAGRRVEGDVPVAVWSEQPIDPTEDFHVDSIRAQTLDPDTNEEVYLIKYAGYELGPDEGWEPWETVRDLAATDAWRALHPNLPKK